MEFNPKEFRHVDYEKLKNQDNFTVHETNKKGEKVS